MPEKKLLNSFSGNIPENYDEFLNSLFFEPYAQDLAKRIIALQPEKILEVACGTGIVTSHLQQALPPFSTITATDINPAMLALAQKKFSSDERIKMLVVDAHQLPFENDSFDCIFGQFGVMFYTNKRKAYLESFRVLNPGGVFVFNTWGEMAKNPIIQLAMELLSEYFPDNPPSFYNLPFSYFDHNIIRDDLMSCGFKNISIIDLEVTGRSANALDTARGLLKGTPVYSEIAERNYNLLPELIEQLSKRLAEAYGSENLKVPLQAVVVTAEK